MDRVLRSGKKYSPEMSSQEVTGSMSAGTKKRKRNTEKKHGVATEVPECWPKMSSQEVTGITSFWTKKRKSEISKKKKTEKRHGPLRFPKREKMLLEMIKSDKETEKGLSRSKTVEIPILQEKETVKRHDVTAIPVSLYKVIVEAADIRKRLETDPNDKDLLRKLSVAEGRISSFTYYHKRSEVLAQDWEYDPDPVAINNLIPKKLEVVLDDEESEDEEEYQKRKHRCACLGPPLDPDIEYPDTCYVGLNEKEKKIWEEFKDFDKETPARNGICMVGLDKKRMSIKVDNPVVGLIGGFAVSVFNQTVEMFVKKGEHNNLRDCVFKECKYLKLVGEYIFHITIEGIEEGILGVYQTRVVCKPVDGGYRTLTYFFLKNRIPDGKNKATTPSQTTNPDHWCDPEDDFYSGLKCRAEGTTCPGYDYKNPWGFDGP